MYWLLPHFYTLILPLILANILHMAVVKLNFFNSIAIPLSIPLFGNNKTYRGFILLPLFTGLFTLIIALLISSQGRFTFITGFIYGLCYLLAELPTSYVKRKMGIPPGSTNPKHPYLQLLADKSDSLILIFTVYYFIASITFSETITLFSLSLSIHLILSFLLYKLKIKKNV